MTRKDPKIDQLFHALGDPTRRAILDRLSHAPTTVTRLAEAQEITLTAVGQHLQILEECGLVRTEKLGRVRTCSIDSKGFDRLEQWVRDHRTTWERKLDRLSALLDEEDKTSCTGFELHVNLHRPGLPDVGAVLADRPVRRELADARDVEDRHPRPALLIAVRLRSPGPGSRRRTDSRPAPGTRRIEQRVDERREQLRSPRENSPLAS